MITKKKKLAVRLYDAIFPPKAATHKRGYQAGRVSRANADWTTERSTANYDLRRDLANVRARSRDAAHNHGHFRKFLGLTVANVIGNKGVLLQPNARDSQGSLNTDLNKRVLDAWKLWGHRETCTISGKLDWLGVQRLVVTQLARDGEFLVQKVEADNPFGFSLRVWDVNWLDETYEVMSVPGGNRIIMSIEVDDNDKPVAYWLTPPNEYGYSHRRDRQRTRIPADQMIHGFIVTEDETQVRGIPWGHAALIEENDLKSYKTGVSDVARMATHTLYNIEQEIVDGEVYTGDEDDEGNATLPIIDTRRMSVNFLPPGHKMSMLKPEQPTQNHSAYVKTCLMDVATALGLPYFMLAGDMEAVNFSSSRVGLDDAREGWKGIQDFVSVHLCREVFHAWARSAMFTGGLKVKGREFAEIQNPAWRARGWKYIDPTKDVNADISKLENNLTTWTDVLNEQGIDLIELLEKRKAEIELARSYGIDLVIAPKTAAPAAKPAEGDADDTDPPPKSEDRGYSNGHLDLLS